MSLYSTTALSLVVLDTDWVPPSGSVVDLHLVQLEVDVDVHSGREGHWVRNRTQWIRFRTQLDIMHKQTWINHDRITLFKKFFQFPSLLIIVEFSTLKNLGNLTTKNSTHHEFVATDHEFVATDHEFVATDYEFVVWTSFIYCVSLSCPAPPTTVTRTPRYWLSSLPRQGGSLCPILSNCGETVVVDPALLLVIQHSAQVCSPAGHKNKSHYR